MPSEPFLIRPVRPQDTAALWALFHRAVHQRAGRDYSPAQCAAWAPSPPDLPAWHARIMANAPVVLEIDGQPAGFADIQSDGYIDQFFVDPDIRGRGIADALLLHRIQRGRAMGLQSLYANVSLSAEAFFKRHGFRVVFRQQFMHSGTVFRNARMRLALD